MSLTNRRIFTRLTLAKTKSLNLKTKVALETEQVAPELPVEQCRHSLQIPTLVPEVHRYIFFSSRGFGMILALILYISIWINLYSTVEMFTSGHTWITSIPVTLTAVIVTAVVIIFLNQQQKKINTNTDIILAAANESFMKYNVILGISDRSQCCGNSPSLCFIYFHLWGCQQKLSQRLTSMHKDDIKHCLDQLFIVIEIPADPMLAQLSTEEHMTEESPLLASESRHKSVLCSKKIPLILWDKPEVMARQLLVVASACYVRLLISGQLPKAPGAGHTGVLDVPCPCQFIEHSVLTSGRCFTWM
uniref:Transmembrane protein 268 n=1 Tax=Pyxicephalus adspersus TaxID=30357 RepID=A0AAV3AE97_PYXAD|nr:TPA: hypothetical protein GDO54_018181 [Pyxicephalus adspersus]